MVRRIRMARRLLSDIAVPLVVASCGARSDLDDDSIGGAHGGDVAIADATVSADGSVLDVTNDETDVSAFVDAGDGTVDLDADDAAVGSPVGEKTRLVRWGTARRTIATLLLG
jgi:hypothetical protein